MTSKFNYHKLFIASKNSGKVENFKELFKPYDLEIVSAIDYNIEEPEETGITFLENSILKAEYYGKKTNLPVLSDDSGLSIKALDNYPGVYTANIAGPNKDYNIAFEKIQSLLVEKGLKSSPAHFTCVLSLRYPDGAIQNFEGIVNGKISFPKRGKNGFGYDSIFIPDGFEQSFAQMEPEDKCKLSHRGLAIKKLIETIFV